MNDDRGSAPLHQRRPPQISLGFMLLMTLVLAAMCAGLYRASRVPAVVKDVYQSLGWEVPPSEPQIERSLHVYFLLFTYTAPLILAGILSTILGIRRWLSSQGGASRRSSEKLGDMETNTEIGTRPGSPTSTKPITATE